MRAWVLATLASTALVGCGDPTWATVFENDSGQPVLIRVETRPFNADAFTTDFMVQPKTRIEVGGNGVGSVGQVVRVSLLNHDCQVVESEPIGGFDEGGVVQLGPDGRLSMIAGGNTVAGDEAIASDRCL